MKDDSKKVKKYKISRKSTFLIINIKSIIFILTLFTISSLYLSYNSDVSFPRNGFYGLYSVGFYGGKEVYNIFSTFLYRDDRLSFQATLSEGSYQIEIVIKGLLTNRMYNWSGYVEYPRPKLPVFIPEDNDWYIIYVKLYPLNSTEEDSFNADIILSSYENERRFVADLLNMFILPILVLSEIVVLTSIYLYLKFRTVRMFSWEVSSFYKWIISGIVFVIFTVLLGVFTSVLLDHELLAFPEEIDNFVISPFAIIDGVYPQSLYYRFANLILILSLMINLLNVSYYMDRKFHRIYLSMGYDKSRIFLLKFMTGYLLILIPFTLAKIFMDFLIFGSPVSVLKVYTSSYLWRFLYDSYFILYYYVIIFSITISLKSMSSSILASITPLLLRSWIGDNAVVSQFFGYPLWIRYSMIYCREDLLQCFLSNNTLFLILPFLILIVGYIVFVYRELE